MLRQRCGQRPFGAAHFHFFYFVAQFFKSLCLLPAKKMIIQDQNEISSTVGPRYLGLLVVPGALYGEMVVWPQL